MGGPSTSCMTSADPPGPSPALSLIWRWSGRQTLPGRSKLSWEWVGSAAWAGLQRDGFREEEVEEEGGVAKVEGTYNSEDPKCSFLPSLVPHRGVLKV